MSRIEDAFPKIRRAQAFLLAAGTAALALGAAGLFYDPAQFFRSYLIGYLFLLGTALGCMGFLMLYHLTSGFWGLILRRLFEAASRTLPLMALLTVPLLLGLPQLYQWTSPEAVASDHYLQVKQFYLTVPFFVLRQVLYFAIWLALAYFLNKWSAVQDTRGDDAILRRLRSVSGPGILLYGITITFAAVDWLMSLEPQYYSTTFGFRLITGQAVNGLAFGISAAMLLSRFDPVAPLVTRKHLRDMGNLMLAAVMLWAYIAFTEYLIVWAGNLPAETSWFRRRFSGGWDMVAALLMALHFFVPFLLLLQRAVKHRPRLLAGVCIWLLLMRWVELLWMIGPSRHPSFFVHWMDLLVPAGMAGIWAAAFLRQFVKRPLVPAFDPLLQEAVHERGTAPA